MEGFEVDIVGSAVEVADCLRSTTPSLIEVKTFGRQVSAYLANRAGDQRLVAQ